MDRVNGIEPSCIFPKAPGTSKQVATRPPGGTFWSPLSFVPSFEILRLHGPTRVLAEAAVGALEHLGGAGVALRLPATPGSGGLGHCVDVWFEPASEVPCVDIGVEQRHTVDLRSPFPTLTGNLFFDAARAFKRIRE